MNLDYSLVLNDLGQPIAVLALVAETTQRVLAERRQRAAEKALDRERHRSRGVLENLAEAFVLLDHDFKVIDINSAALRLEERDASAVLGKSHWEAWPGSELCSGWRQVGVTEQWFDDRLRRNLVRSDRGIDAP